MFRLFLIFLVFIFTTGTSQASEPKTFEEDKCTAVLSGTCLEQEERIVDDFPVSRCWKYEERFKCTGKEENNCDVFESNRGCDEIKGECLEESPTGLCNHYKKEFDCGDPTITKAGSKIITSEFKVLKDEKDLSGCDAEIKNKYCQVSEETCIEPGETRNINGKEVYKDCWKWSRKYICRTDTKIDECKELRNQGCKEKSRECIHEEEGRCDHYVVQYECERNKKEKVDCVASQFCIDGICEEQERNINDGFGKAASYLGVLAQVQKDGESCGCDKEKDPDCSLQGVQSDKCQLFKGQSYFCKKITGEYNCCSNKGFVRPLAGCSASEKDLSSKRQAKICHFVGSWKKKPLKIEQKKSYCCFNSQLARIIQEQGRAQLGIGWGDRKNPDCRALTLQEIQRIDFSKIKFDELHDDLKAKAKKDFGAKGEEIAEKLKTPDMSNVIKDKMRSFYGKK